MFLVRVYLKLVLFAVVIVTLFFQIATQQSYSADIPEAELKARALARIRNPNFPTPWWKTISKKPPSWYRSDSGREMAENVISWQDNGTGWPLMNTTREPFTGDVSRAGPWGMRAALIKATVNEIRFLARAYSATKEDRYLKSLLGGLNFILNAQYPSGGWPHSFPPRQSDYSHYATFNDDMMPDLMTLLDEVATSREFRFLSSEVRQSAKKSFELGVDFILKSQIRVDGKLTGWCQQHDEVTYEPRPARKFEPVAISGAESASVLRLLMNIDKPSSEVTHSIESGIAWYHESQLDGIQIIRRDGDRILKENPNAQPMWARFYEIGTNRPIFAGRDGIVRYSMAEIEKERRGGYSWYNHAGTYVFALYEDWKHAQKWHDQPPTNREESLVRDYVLPELLRANDGSQVVNSADWEQRRRPEIMKLLEQHQFGVTPNIEIPTKVEIIERDAAGLKGLARRTQVRITFPENPDSLAIHVLLYVPKDETDPVPTLLHIGFSPNVLVVDEPGIEGTMAWSAQLKTRIPASDSRALVGFDPSSIIQRGYGVALVYYGDISPDFDDERKNGIRSLFANNTPKPKPDAWGSIGAWSWGLSRVLDYLVTDENVDGDQIALSGVSRLGKTVLWAGAQDERFAMIIPMLSGEGGAAISRRNFGETIADLTKPSRYHYWYAPRYEDYAFDVDSLPIDGHMLVAMAAPRPILLIVGNTDSWSDPRGEFISAKAATPVYQLYNKRGLDLEEFPEPGTVSLNDIGFFMHVGGHTVLPNDFKVIADFMDMHFRR